MFLHNPHIAYPLHPKPLSPAAPPLQSAAAPRPTKAAYLNNRETHVGGLSRSFELFGTGVSQAWSMLWLGIVFGRVMAGGIA